MQLTRMYLNPRRRQTIRFQRDPQALHAAVESAFPPGAESGRTLWRLDVDGSETKLLILSASTPSLEHLQEQAGWETEQTWESRPYERLLSRLQKGQRYGFRLTGNPVHTVSRASGMKQRLAHVSASYQLLWLAQKAERIGVRFLDEAGGVVALPDRETEPPAGLSSVKVSHREKLQFRRGEQQVTIVRTRFEGGLEVADVDLLRAALVGGIGRAKAYGCGLMTLAALRSISRADASGVAGASVSASADMG